MQRKQKAFTGELKKPIKWDGPDLFPTRGLLALDPTQQEIEQIDTEMLAARQRLDHRKSEKLELLKQHYGLNEDSSDRALLLRLAEDFVPGFQVDYGQKKSGRPKKWADNPESCRNRYMELLADIEQLKREKPIGDSQACRLLIQRCGQYGDRYVLEKGQTVESAAKSLNNRLADARNPKINPWYKLIANADTDEEAEYRTQAIIENFAFRGERQGNCK